MAGGKRERPITGGRLSAGERAARLAELLACGHDIETALARVRRDAARLEPRAVQENPFAAPSAPPPPPVRARALPTEEPFVNRAAYPEPTAASRPPALRRCLTCGKGFAPRDRLTFLCPGRGAWASRRGGGVADG